MYLLHNEQKQTKTLNYWKNFIECKVARPPAEGPSCSDLQAHGCPKNLQTPHTKNH